MSYVGERESQVESAAGCKYGSKKCYQTCGPQRERPVLSLRCEGKRPARDRAILRQNFLSSAGLDLQ